MCAQVVCGQVVREQAGGGGGGGRRKRGSAQPKTRTPHKDVGTNIKTNGPRPPHTRDALRRRLQPLYTETHMVSSSGFLPKAKPMQHPCSHYNAFCSATWQTRIYPRTWQQNVTTIMQPFHCDQQPQIPKHPITTHTQTHPKQIQPTVTAWQQKKTAKTKGPHPRHARAALHRRLQPLYTEKHKVSSSGFLPNTTPMQHPCSHYNAFCSITWLTRMCLLRTWQLTMATIYSHFTVICSK